MKNYIFPTISNYFYVDYLNIGKEFILIFTVWAGEGELLL